MKRKASSRSLIILVLALILLGLWPSGLYAESGDDPLRTRSDIQYVLSEEKSGVSVVIDMRIYNQDPMTKKRSSGRVYFYNRYFFPISKAAKNIRVKRGDGRKLRFQRKKNKPNYDELVIFFGRRLHYKKSIRLQITYDLESVTSPGDFVSPNVVHVEAYFLGDEGRIGAEVPPGYEVKLDSAKCFYNGNEEGGKVQCAAIANYGDRAFILEAFRLTENQEKVFTPEPISLQNRDIILRIRYGEGEEKWAKKVARTLRKTMPHLERIMGFPYEGPSEITVRHAPVSELEGYEGFYYEESQEIVLGYGASKETMVHEAAHMWSTPFAARWLSEGWAEWSAREAMRRAKMKRETSARPLRDYDNMDLPLRNWEWTGAIDDEDEDELTGYAYEKSAQAVAKLVKRVGLKRLQAINRAFYNAVQDGHDPADTDAYFLAIRNKKRDVSAIWEKYIEN
ncbi:MAG: M1 family metallopeptidase [Chloroflexi bacterium]|nr:M1 family metallopeptidase [Chloroflexota bacterium]